MESRIEQEALENLKEILEKEAHISVIQEHGPIRLSKAYQADGYFLAKIGKQEIPICVEVKGHVTNLLQIKNFIEYSRNFEGLSILTAESINDSLRKHLRELNIGFLEQENGELYLPLTISLSDSKSASKGTRTKESGFRAENFLKLFFYLLENPESLKFPQRELSKELDISLGAVNGAIKNLKQSNILHSLEDSHLIFVDKEKALQKWVQLYSSFDKEKILIGRFSSIQENFYRNWKDLNLREVHGYWSGEPAASLSTNYLRPEVFTIYAYEPQLGEVIRKLRLKKDPQGNIFIYKAFWPEKINNIRESLVPMLLTYADLVNSGIDRNIETAQLLKNQKLSERSHVHK